MPRRLLLTAPCRSREVLEPSGRIATVKWLNHAVTSDRAFVRNRAVVNGAPLLGQYAEDLIRDAVDKGYLAE